MTDPYPTPIRASEQALIDGFAVVVCRCCQELLPGRSDSLPAPMLGITAKNPVLRVAPPSYRAWACRIHRICLQNNLFCVQRNRMESGVSFTVPDSFALGKTGDKHPQHALPFSRFENKFVSRMCSKVHFEGSPQILSDHLSMPRHCRGSTLMFATAFEGC
jgi:hypothetical protein